MEKTMNNELADTGLKPCPFCGGAASLYDYEDREDHNRQFTVRCHNGCGRASLNKRAIIERWNTRADAGGDEAAQFRYLRDHIADLAESLTDALVSKDITDSPAAASRTNDTLAQGITEWLTTAGEQK